MQPMRNAAQMIALSQVALAACSPLPVAATRCDEGAMRPIAFTGAAQMDALTVSASGETCATAIVTVSIQPAGGPPIQLASATLADLPMQLDRAQPLAPQALADALATYAADVQLDTGASTLPEWNPGDFGPGFDTGHEISSPVDQTAYETLRLSKPNMLCLMEARDSSACHVWDAAAGRTVVILRNAL